MGGKEREEPLAPHGQRGSARAQAPAVDAPPELAIRSNTAHRAGGVMAAMLPTAALVHEKLLVHQLRGQHRRV